MKRNQFLINAVEKYFISILEEEYLERKIMAVERMKKTSQEIIKIDMKDWDPVAEIRKSRDNRADELLKRWKER